MSVPRHWLALLLGAVLLAPMPRLLAVVPEPPPPPPIDGELFDAASDVIGNAAQPEQAPPPSEQLAVRVEPLESQVAEGAPLRFRVDLPNFIGLADLRLTYAVVPGGGDAEPGVDFDQPRGPVVFASGATEGMIEIPTLVNPDPGGARLIVAVLHGEQIVGRSAGIIVDRPPPRVEVSDTSIEEGGELVFTVAIDPTAEVRGPWTYSYRVEAGTAAEATDYTSRSGPLRFDAEGRPLDDIRIMTRLGEAMAGPRTLRLLVVAGDTVMGSGVGTILDSPGPGGGDEESGGTSGPEWSVDPIDIVVLVLVLGTVVGILWWLWPLRDPVRDPIAVGRPEPDRPEPGPETTPLTGPFQVAAEVGDHAIDDADFGLPLLEIEAVPGPHDTKLPEPLPIEPEGRAGP